MTIPTARDAVEKCLAICERQMEGVTHKPNFVAGVQCCVDRLRAYLNILPAPVGDAKGADEAIAGYDPIPFHPSASHVEPAYRDGWNAALRAVERASQPVEAGAVTEALRRIEDAIAAFPSLRAPMNGQAHASVTYALNCARDLLSAHPAPPEAVAKEEDALDSSKLFTAVRIAQVLFNAEDLGITTARTAPKDDASVALNAETIDKLHEMFWEAIGVDCDFYTGDVMERWEAMEKTLRDLASRRATYAAANPLGGPAKLFDAIAERLRDGEDYDAVLKDYGVRVDGKDADHG